MKKHGIRYKPLIMTLAILLLVMLTYWGFNFFFLYTNNAYLQANVVNIAPQVAGKIAHINVVDLQHVKAGDLLLTLKDNDYRQQVERANSLLTIAQNNYLKLKAQISELNFSLNRAQADATFKRQQWQRYQSLQQQGAVANARANQAYSDWQQAAQSVRIIQRSITTNKQIVGNSLTDYAPYRQAQAGYKLAQINEQHTRLYAPVSGYVTALRTQPGDYLNVGQAIFTIITDNTWWVTARIKEDDLAGISKGDTVFLIIGGSNSGVLHGKIYGIGWGVNRQAASSTVIHSPLPYIPQQVNWIQLAQRFPVKINLADIPPSTVLRVGATAHVFIIRHHDK